MKFLQVTDSRLLSSIIIFVSLLCVAVCYGEKDLGRITDDNYRNDRILSDWQKWMSAFGKQYSNRNEMVKRFSIWIENQRKLHHLIDYAQTQTGPGMNNFADLTLEEYKTNYLLSEWKEFNFRQSRVNRINYQWIPDSVQGLPDSVDWRENGWVTPVQDQGQSGQSYTFVTTGTVEAQHMNVTGDLVKLSEAQLVDCVTGFPSVVSGLDYIEANGSISQDDYSSPKGKCEAEGKPVTATISTVIQVPKGNEQALQIAVALVGPVAVYVDASHFSFQLYTGVVYYEPDCSSNNLDHTLLVVGYGTEQGQDYWLAKNSWGVNWGESGYIKMARNRNNNCGIATNALYPLT
ncbi:procathepsin L-like [Convolutriloba macropyga]|uniref:procathepsin L-like n=1 Tax=Convolutriloba macropyga TaxID=536237 RepID=UPI003F51F57E